MGTDLQVRIGTATFQNPVFTASGTFGYGQEFADLVDLPGLGAVVAKGISLSPRHGNPPPRIVETAAGMLNAIGLENVGVDRFINDKMPFFREKNIAVIANILGDCLEDYEQLASRLDPVPGLAAIEVNISCPNVKAGGVAFGTNPVMAAAVTQVVRNATRLPVIIKLSPNVTDIVAIALAVEAAGADAVSLINTLLGMAIDIHNRRPRLGNVFGGLSGPAIKPVALRMVYQVARQVKIPVIGIGGIMTAADAVEFILAGACAVQLGTVNFINPGAAEQVLAGIVAYMRQHRFAALKDMVGALIV